MQKSATIIPTVQLYIGSNAQTVQKTYAYLQSIFCTNSGCYTCINCMQINAKKHNACLWISSKKQYLLEDLIPIQEKIQFSLSEDECFFFIIENAELLSPLSSNALLKSLEEPPVGYYFILEATEITELPSTVLSRCITFYTKQDSLTIAFKPLYDHFTSNSLPPSLFLKELERSKITEDQSHELCRHILQFWQKKYLSLFESCPVDRTALALVEKKLNHIYNSIEQLPTVGNAKLFWKKLFLQFDQIINS